MNKDVKEIFEPMWNKLKVKPKTLLEAYIQGYNEGFHNGFNGGIKMKK